MERWVLVGFLVAGLLLCFVQAFPQADFSLEPTVASKIESTINDVMKSLQKGFQGLSEDPQFSKFVKDGQNAIERLSESIKNGASQIVPKTD